MITDSAPITSLRRRRSVKPIRQTEIAECGIACLAMISSYWGHEIGLEGLRSRFPVTSRGMTLADIVKLANSLNLSTRPLRIEIEKLPELSYPAILHWGMNHFVVAEREKNGRIYIVDPAHGSGGWHDHESVGRNFTGIALELEPSADFAPEAAIRKLGFSELWGRTQGLWSTVLQAVVLSLVLQIFVIASPYFLQVSIDEAVPAGDADLITTLGLGFAAFAIIAGIAHAMRGYVLLSAGTMLSYAMSTNVARHMLRLPIAWFEKRSVGDVLSRFQSVQPLRILLTEGMSAAALDGLMATLTLLAMMIYSPVLAMIPLLSLIAYSILRALTLPKERAAEGEAIIALGKEQSAMIETLRGMVTIRLSGQESLRQAAWQNRLTDMLSERYSHDKIKTTQMAGGYMLEALETVSIVWIGVLLVMDGGFSIGMLFAFAAWRLQFSAAARRVIDQVSEWRKAKLHLDRLSDIAFTNQDPGFSEPEFQREELKGKIELRNVSHRYGEYEPHVLEDVNLTIEPGENMVITGPSGSGKSTLIKILLGLVEPSSGEILVDGKHLSSYGRRAYRAQIGAVLQDDTLFAGSIMDNVSGFTGADEERVRKALSDASVLEEVEAMPMREHTLVGDMGSTLSGGQKQRILIARALYSSPRILVMDEGTSHLDAAHEANVNKTISRMGVTRIGIAHRKETIAAAKRVVTLRNGVIENDTLNE